MAQAGRRLARLPEREAAVRSGLGQTGPVARAHVVDDASSVGEWLTTWQTFVRRRDFDQARTLFSPAVLGFGSVATVAGSLDELEASQWRRVWPRLGDFTFEDDHLAVVVSTDRLLATVAVTWASTWVDNGNGRDRGGRRSCSSATTIDDPWRAVHTHFSLNPV